MEVHKEQLLYAIKDFTQEVYLQLASSQQNENFVFSPLSLHSILSSLYFGAEVNTKTYAELQSALGGLTNPNHLKVT